MDRKRQDLRLIFPASTIILCFRPCSRSCLSLMSDAAFADSRIALPHDLLFVARFMYATHLFYNSIHIVPSEHLLGPLFWFLV